MYNVYGTPVRYHDYTCVCPVGVYVPVGGKKLLTFMDDFNMPAKDTFGSQPPLELIRHWIDYGFWYDRSKQIVKHIKVCYLIAITRTVNREIFVIKIIRV